MAPLPCSPVSNSTASESQSIPTSDDDSDHSLTTPRPGPADPAQRTAAHLSQPSLPTFSVPPPTTTTTRVGETPHSSHDNRKLSPPAPESSNSRLGSTSSSPGPFRSDDNRASNPVPPSSSSLAPSTSSPPRRAPFASIGAFDWQERKRSISFNPGAAQPKSSRQSSYGSSFLMTGARSPPVSPRMDPRHHLVVRRGAEEYGSLHANAATTAAAANAADSSADENTAIVRKVGPSGLARPGYGAVEARDRLSELEDDDHLLGGDLDAPAEMPGRLRRRRSGGLKGKGSRSASVRSGRQGRRAGEEGEEGDEGEEGWFKRLLEKYGSVELENKGSVARDHLALERTFLAWLRTSLSFASIGIAVTQLFRLNKALEPSKPGQSGHDEAYENTNRLRQVGKPLGATFLGISILILLLGFHRYFESQHYVIRGKFPASRVTIILVSFVAFALIMASLVVIIVVAPSAFEKR